MKKLWNIYIIHSNKTNKVYIGATTHSLEFRFYQHKFSWINRNKKSLPFCLKGVSSSILFNMFPNEIDTETFKIEILERTDDRTKENTWIEWYKPLCVNKKRGYLGLTKNQYAKIWRDNNKHKVKISNKKYYYNKKLRLQKINL